MKSVKYRKQEKKLFHLETKKKLCVFYMEYNFKVWTTDFVSNIDI